MEICPLSCDFPAANRRFGKIPAYPLRGRPSTTPSLISCTAVGNPPSVSGTNSPNRMFILGMGYVGKFFAQDLKNQGWNTVSGTCTSLEKKRELEELGFDDIHLFDANEPEQDVLDDLSRHTHLLVSIPPLVGVGDPLLYHEERLKRMIMEGNLRWLCYLSSTSVYGDCGGAWVDEDYAVNPTDVKAKARRAAEEGWLKLAHDLGISSQIFRLGGIYGPGRSAVDTLIKKRALSNSQRIRASKSYTSRIHVADICRALHASISNPAKGKIYNIVDDDPAPRVEVFSYACDVMERKWPGYLNHQDTPLDSSGSLSDERMLRGEKRVSNARLKKELVAAGLVHPDYRSGLGSIIDNIMDNPFL